MAVCLDIAIPIVVIIVLTAGGSTSDAAGTVALLAAVVFIGFAGYLFARGTTPGKLVLGMRVIKENGRPAGFFRMLVREWVGKWISGLILGLGFLWILFDGDRQGWHDKLMSTYVVQG